MRPAGFVTLLTDFGRGDSYAAQMKGVILRINPEAVIMDITHDIPPGDIRGGAFVLMTGHSAFPPGTVHVAVVDPGVGSRRKAVIVVTHEGFFVGPDNGVLSWALRGQRVLRMISLANREYFLPAPSATFHGRDIFAPVAAHLTMGVDPDECGQRIGSIIRLRYPHPRCAKGRIAGEVIHCDGFGNLITNIESGLLTGPRWMIAVGKRRIGGVLRTYADVPAGRPLAHIGSSGFLEISVNRGSARDVFGMGEGLTVLAVRE